MPDTKQNKLPDWRPSCSLEAIKARAEVYASIRAFFYSRVVLEVETPLLSKSTATDPFLDSIQVNLSISTGLPVQAYFLHTSPEFPMKRLLASGSGPIYQLCKTFRNAETGHRHNPEFTMLEWYRPGFDMNQLMVEVSELVSKVLNNAEVVVEKLSYREAFLNFLNIDPFLATDTELIKLAQDKAGYFSSGKDGCSIRDDYLNLLLGVCIEPFLGKNEQGDMEPVFLYGYPASQASLAKLKQDEFGQEIAERFELYINGLEIANGYFELTDAEEQVKRFNKDNENRKSLGLSIIPVDENLLAALDEGMPSCSGVALGVDRLLMIKLNTSSIEEVISFPIARA
ncbi:MAG: lysyl-tRNA synthetase class 2 [Oleiphilaceae bacterium]|jgi:lysyl-tRNA synthetase class 2